MMLSAIVALLVGCNEVTLEASIAAANAECPMRIDEQTVVTKIQRHGDYVEYVAVVEETADMDVNNLNIPEIREQLRKNILDGIKNQNDNDVREMIRLCKENKVGIEYRYVGSRTKNEATVRIDYWDF